MDKYRMAHEASICMTVYAESEEEARSLCKQALTGVVDFQEIFATQLEGQPHPDAVVYLCDGTEPVIEDVEAIDEEDED